MTINELNEIKQKYKIIEMTADFINPSYNISRAKHLDTARYIVCTLTENGIPRNVKADETARIRLQKPDKTYVYNDCDILDDGRVFITLTEQILAVEGNAVCDIQLTDEETGIIYSTKNFIINIDKTAVDNSIIESSDEFDALNSLIATNKKLNAELNENEDIRKVNENTRISNENTRIANENTRKSMEIQRTNAENTRISNENTRIADENIRISNEDTRNTNEISRQNDTALAISNSEKAAKKANDAADDLQNKLDSHYFVSVSDIIDNLISTATNKPLSAKQGKILKDLISELTVLTDGKVDKVSGKGLSTNDYTDEDKARLQNISDNTDNKFLQLSGGTVDGRTAFRQGISGYALSSSASHGKGTAGWQYAFQITTTSTYQNQFLEFSIVQRNRIGKLYIKLVSNKTAGVVSVGEFYTIGNISVAYVCSDNALDVYIQKSEAYDEIDCLITRKGSYMNGTVITWVDTVVSSLPDGAIEVPANTIKLDNSIKDIILSCEDNTKPTKCFIKRNIDNSAAYLGFSNSNDILGYIGINNLNIPVYRDKENHNYPLLIANGPNIGTVGINTPSSGGTALSLNNSNSNDDRTYLQFRNKDINAGYLSMSDNDLYTYKKINGINGNCKVLDSENFNDSVSLKQVCSFTHAAYGGVCTVYRYGMIIAVTISGLWATGTNDVLVGDTNFVGVGNQKHYVDEYGNYIQFTGGGEIHLVIKSSQGKVLDSSFSATALFVIHST